MRLSESFKLLKWLLFIALVTSCASLIVTLPYQPLENLKCTAHVNQEGSHYKIVFEVLDKDKLTLSSYAEGELLDRCEGTPLYRFGTIPRGSFTHYIDSRLSCTRHEQSKIKLSEEGMIKFEEDHHSKGILKYSEHDRSALCDFPENKFNIINELKLYAFPEVYQRGWFTREVTVRDLSL